MIEDLELNEIISSGPPIEPTAQVDAYTVAALCPILYDKNYSTAISYLRTMMLAREYSARSLSLTAYIIALNPAHYTVWTYRLDTLLHRNADDGADELLHELEYLDALAAKGSKNYQLWHHRERVITSLSSEKVNVEAELGFLETMLDDDEKNYHVWSYRQWFVRSHPACRGLEEGYVGARVRRDVYNNSAWNHRYFLLFEINGPMEAEAAHGEVKYVQDMITLAPDNAASWNYFKGILRRLDIEFRTVREFAVYFEDSLPALEFMLTIHQDVGELDDARRVCGELERRDRIRKKYWQYRASLIK